MALTPNDPSSQLFGDQSSISPTVIQRHNAWMKRGLAIAAYPYALTALRRSPQAKPQTLVRHRIQVNSNVNLSQVQNTSSSNQTTATTPTTSSTIALPDNLQGVPVTILEQSFKRPKPRPISIRRGGRTGAKIGMRIGSVVSVVAALSACFFPASALITGPIAILSPLAAAGFGSIFGVIISALRRLAQQRQQARQESMNTSTSAAPPPPSISFANTLNAIPRPSPQRGTKVEHDFGKMDKWHGKGLKDMQPHVHVVMHPYAVSTENSEEGKTQSETITPSMTVD